MLTDQGINEQGTHAELMAMDGTYARLYRMQFNESVVDVGFAG